MSRLWLRIGLAGSIACTTFGCSGQNLEGRWQGPFPLEDAKACVLNLYKEHQFDLACDGHVWVGEGRYEQMQTSVRFTFSTLVHRDEKLARAPDIEVHLQGRGNAIVLSGANDRKYELTRKMP